jgi:hypothetical protein
MVRVAVATPTVLVSTGDASPFGLPFSHFSDAALDDRGRVAFVGAATALFRRAGAGLVHVAGAGDTVGGRTLAGVAAPAAAGPCIAFHALVVGGGAVLIRRCGAATDVVVAAPGTAPGGTAIVRLGTTVVVSDVGHVVGTALLADGTTVALRVDPDGAVREVVRTGESAPAGGTFAALRPVGVSRDGVVGIRGTVASGRDGLFAWDGTMVTAVAVVGDASPAGGSYSAVGGATMSGAGVWAFRGTIVPGPVGGIFLFDPADRAPRALVLEGDASPLGGTIAQIANSVVPSVNASGRIAFRASLADAPFSAAVLTVGPGEAPAVVVSAGAVTRVGRLARLRDPVLADDGSVVVRALIVGGAAGLFVARDGELAPLAVFGDPTDRGDNFRFAEAAAGSSADDAVVLGIREGLFLAGTGGVRVVAALGDRTPFGGVYAGFDAPSAGGGRIVFGADVTGGSVSEALIAVDGRPRRLVGAGGPRARGGVTSLFADPIDPLARAGVAGGVVAFQGALEGAGTALFVLGGGRRAAVAREGASSPLGGRFVGFGSPAAGRGVVAFVGVVSGGEAPTGVFVRRRGRLRAAARAGGQVGGRLGGRFASFDPPVAAASGAAFRATLGNGGDAVFLVPTRGRPATVLASGDALPGGGRVLRTTGATFAGRTLVVLADLEGAPATSALVALPLGRRGDAENALVTASTVVVAEAGTLGLPAGNRKGALAWTGASVGGGGTTAVVLEDRPAAAGIP